MMGHMTPIHEQRLDHVFQRIKATGARRVLDLGCGEGALLHRLVGDSQFERIVGLEPCGQTLRAARALLVEPLMGAAGARLELVAGSLTEPQPALAGYDAAALVETIEHVPPRDLSRLEQNVFGQMRPGSVLITTPNHDYNPLLGLAPGEFREADHRFEWGQARFRRWAQRLAARHGYRVGFGGVGDVDPQYGPMTQTALFRQAA